MATTQHDPLYVMGRSDQETARLQRQAQLYGPLTRRLFVEAGVGSGMRVLDVGSGAGDVALLLAELVGPTGQVVGVARRRLRCGRRTLCAPLCGNRVDVLQSCMRRLRPGGLVLFQEHDVGAFYRAVPASPPDWIGYEFLADHMRSTRDLYIQHGIATDDEEMMQIDTLAARLRAEVVSTNGVFCTFPALGIWARTDELNPRAAQSLEHESHVRRHFVQMSGSAA